MRLPLLLSLIGLIHGLPDRKRRFDGHQVFRVLPKTRNDMEKVMDAAKHLKADIWKVPKFLNSTLDLHVDAQNVQKFITVLKNMEVGYSTMIADLQKAIDEENYTPAHLVKRATASFSLSHFHSFSEISSYLDSVAHVSSKATVHSAGVSVQGRSLKYLKVSTGGNKKAILIDGGIHAREWIAPAVVLYLIDQFVMNPDNDPTIARMVQKYDWYFMPLVNPDGYEYSRSNNRMWRKNKSSSTSIFGTCTGTDLNRNFGFQWNPAIGGSRDQCDEIFGGTQAFSEPEARALGQLMNSLRGTAVAYLNFHSYGQMWLWPWGYTTRQLPADLTDLKRAANTAVAAMYPLYHGRFTTGGDATDLYPAAGGADDYAKGHAGIKYSYTVELRDTGRHGFILPASYIIPSGEETLKGVLALASDIATHENL